jgi:hypothetical protein
VQALIAALDDAPEVVRPAAQALGRLAPAPVAGPALAARLPAADDVLFLDLADALGALGDPSFSLAALRAALYRGRLVPVLGPDFPTALTGLPDRASAVQALAQQNGLPAPASAASASLADTAAATMLGGSRFAFTNFLYQTYDDQLLQPGPIHAALAKLSAPLWLSAAYDGLLAKALKANSIVLGEDTRYWKPNRPTIVRLAGDPATRRGLVVLEGDWAALRENEGDRRLLLGYLRSELAGKALLFLGFDPTSPDFALLVRHLLNEHLAGLRVAPFLLWPEPPPAPLAWSGLPMRPIPTDPLAFIQALAGTAEKM